MNDFFLAKNGYLTFSYNQQNYTVKQIQMKDFDLWLSTAEKIKALITTKDYSDEFLKAMFEQAPIQCMQVVSIVTDVPDDLVLNCLFPAMKLLLIVNEAFFHEKESAEQGMSRKHKSESTWFDLFQLLVSCGHSHESIMNMSYGTFKKYVDAAIRNQSVNLLSAVNGMRVAYHADKKGFDRFFDTVKIR